MLGLGVWLTVAGCGAPAPPADAVARPTTQQVSSRDGVLTVELPLDLVVHPNTRSILGTSADGSSRVYLRHLPGDALIRVAGRNKDSLTARGWEVEAEHHYEHAIEVKSVYRRGGTRWTRVSWYVARAGRVLLCEGIVAPAGWQALEARLRPLCQGVIVEAAPPAAADASDDGGG